MRPWLIGVGAIITALRLGCIAAHMRAGVVFRQRWRILGGKSFDKTGGCAYNAQFHICCVV